MRRQLLALTFVSLPLAGALLAAQAAGAARTPTGVASASGLDAAALDRGADACTDFYAFACGGWTAGNPVPSDRTRWGRFTELQDRNFTILRRILEAPGGTADLRKARDYYAGCMDETTIERQGAAPLEPELARIDAVTSRAALPALLAHLHSIGVNALFRFGSTTDLTDATRQIADVDQGGLGLPDRDYYLRADARSEELRTKYRAHVQRMLALARPNAAASEADAAFALEKTLAEAAMDRVTRRDPAATEHRMSVAELQAVTPGFSWPRYVAAAAAPPFTSLNVSVPDFMRAVDRIVSTTSLDDVKAYLRWQLINRSAEYLSKPFAQADFEFYGRTLAGQQEQEPRWRHCVGDTDRRLGEALGKAFVEETFGPRAKADMLGMVQGIKTAMKQDIEAAEWMSPETKRAALVKLNAVVDRIGYPDRWRDYGALRVDRADALGNVERAFAFERRRNLRKIGRDVDRTEWSMTPPTVNAYYSPDRNNINFPAGILQPPFYRADRDPALNYGGAGAVIGHELTHGFDDQGRRFDGQGNLRDWWTANDGKAFEERASCVADQYSQYVVAGDTHVNGKLTLGENTADNGGVRLALMAYLAGPGATAQPLDGFTPEQRFFIGYAQIWCENRTDEYERLQAATNPHAPGRYRVNGVVSNMPEFRKAFSCKADAAMVRPQSCRVW